MSLTWMDGVLLVAAAYCAYTDGRHRKIKNYVTFPLMLFGVVANTVLHGLSGLGASLLGLLVCGVLSMLLAFVEGFGMGDVKLFMAIGAVKGLAFSLETMVFSFFLAVLVAILLYPRRFAQGVRNIVTMLRGIAILRQLPDTKQRESALPMAYAILVFGGLLISYYIGGDWLWHFIVS